MISKISLAVLAICEAPFSFNSCSSLKPHSTPIGVVFEFIAVIISTPESPINTVSFGVTPKCAIISLTEKGSERQICFKEVFAEVETQMTKGLTEAETAQLYSLLERVRTNLEEDRGL